MESKSYPHKTDKEIMLIETNISWIFLTGPYVYKMKKAIKFGDVLDYSTLEKRNQACKDEIVYNKRLASSIYLSVESINQIGHVESYAENPIEYVVKMKQLPQDSLLSNKIQIEKKLAEETIIQIAKILVKFHKKNVVQPNFSIFENIFEKWDENFRTTRTYPNFPFDVELEKRVYLFLDNNKDFWQKRKKQGKIVDGHGDLILANIFELNNEIIIFDCIEFNEALRIQDILEEIAFLAMDLDFWEQPELSDLFLKTYLLEAEEEMNTSSAFINFYKSYRAYVRAKVYSSSSIQEKDKEKKQQLLNLTEKYMKLSSSYNF